ncbi:MAG: hypothetical protein PHD43_20010 [Methylococcales bacterium]|nr:hypothetical protein [Methylococcales bacterium]
MAYWNFDEEIDALIDVAVRRTVCTRLNYAQCRMGYPCGRANQGRCGWGGREAGCRCYGDDVRYPSPQRSSMRYRNHNDLPLDEIDSMIDEAVFRPAIRGGRPGPVRRHISPWLSLLRDAQQAIRASANAHVKENSSRFLAAITRAKNALIRGNAEIGHVMSGGRLRQVRDMIGNAIFAITSAREAAGTGGSIFAPGRSLLGVDTHLDRALYAVQAALNAAGLQRL